MIRHPLRTLIRYGIGLVCLFGGVPLMVQLGNLFTPTGSTYSWWAPALTASLVGRRVALPAAAPALLIVLVVFAVAGLVAVSFIRRVPRSKAKQAAKLLNKRRNVAALGRKNRAQEAARLHPNAENLAPGLELGRYKNRPTQYAYQGWRDCGIFILGTGRGKTSALVVPRMIAAPGAALMTSNKVDGVAEVIAGRKGNGTRRVFLFDNQGIYTDGEPTFTIDLLGSVKAMRHAEELAWILDDSSLPDGEPVKKDPHFDPAGRGLLSCFLFAAALEPSVHLQKVYEWIALLDGEQPERILRAAGKVGPANTVRGVMKHPEKTRGSIFAVAQRMASALGDDDLMRWTTPTRGLNVFDPDAFLRSRDTLIMLSQNGPGSGSAGVTGLLQAVCARGEQLAAANGGRLPVPLVGEVDELGNIVRWRRLPAQASHFGSKGLLHQRLSPVVRAGHRDLGQSRHGRLLRRLRDPRLRRRQQRRTLARRLVSHDRPVRQEDLHRLLRARRRELLRRPPGSTHPQHRGSRLDGRMGCRGVLRQGPPRPGADAAVVGTT